jgi:hypothetical protein
LTKDGADILHKLRTLGNDAAHEVKPHSLQELGLAFDVVDYLLLGVFILPVNAKKTFKQHGTWGLEKRCLFIAGAKYSQYKFNII